MVCYTNARPVYNKSAAAVADSALMPLCVEGGGLIETKVKEFVYEVGKSALDCKLVSLEEYMGEMTKRRYCRDLIAKELMEIDLHDRAIYFHLVDFPKGHFKEVSERIFEVIKGLGYSKILVDDRNRSGRDVWGKYGFSGKYLDNLRVKHLEW
jgi:hypothetical protein